MTGQHRHGGDGAGSSPDITSSGGADAAAVDVAADVNGGGGRHGAVGTSAAKRGSSVDQFTTATTTRLDRDQNLVRDADDEWPHQKEQYPVIAHQQQ